MAMKNDKEKKKAIKVVCDKCSEIIKIKEIQSKIIDSEGMVKKQFFICPHCGEEYIIDITDQLLRNMIKNFKALQEKQRQALAKHSSEVIPNMEKLLQLRTNILNKDKLLKERYNGK